jgi:hypothetical protein
LPAHKRDGAHDKCHGRHGKNAQPAKGRNGRPSPGLHQQQKEKNRGSDQRQAEPRDTEDAGGPHRRGSELRIR